MNALRSFGETYYFSTFRNSWTRSRDLSLHVATLGQVHYKCGRVGYGDLPVVAEEPQPLQYRVPGAVGLLGVLQGA